MKLSRVLNIFVTVIIAALVVTAIYYVFKPVGIDGHSCTFDDFDCESNHNFFTAIAYTTLAFIITVTYTLGYWVYLIFSHRLTRTRPKAKK